MSAWDANHIKMAVGVAACTAIAVGFIGWQILQRTTKGKPKSTAKASKDKNSSKSSSLSGKSAGQTTASDADESESSSSFRGKCCLLAYLLD